MRTTLVTGGAGFIGSNFVADLVARGHRVVNLDRLTYAGNLDNLAALADNPSHTLVEGDIRDQRLVGELLASFRPQAVINFAAETHVDRSIDGPSAFVETNVLGTFALLEACRRYVATVPDPERRAFRYLQVSTDEVFGSLGAQGLFTEGSPYAPNSPYAASKAAADHFVRAYHSTYGLGTLTTYCSNNYGPYQFPEKMIPLMILNAIEGRPLPVYGDGMNVRDWLYVSDHCDALNAVLSGGEVGQTYAIGGRNECANVELVGKLCDILDRRLPSRANPRTSDLQTYRDLITFVPDRPGHDRRYAIDPSKIHATLGWSPKSTIDVGLERTVTWYLENREWCRRIAERVYDRERLGLGGTP